jgi:hypothetical protein
VTAFRFTPQTALAFQWSLFQKALDILGPKRSDYSGAADPFANFRSSEHVGVEPWRGSMVRWLDKIQRMRQLAQKGGEGAVKDESLLDTAADALNYCAITMALILETLPEDRVTALLATMPAQWGDPARDAGKTA